MSLPWSEKTLKATPVANDEVMILDSQDTDPDTINKRATLVSLPSSGQTNTASNVGGGVNVFDQKVGVNFQFRTLFGETDKIILTQNIDNITFTLGTDAVTIDKVNTYGDFAQIFRDDKLFIQNPSELFTYQIIASAIGSDIIITLPLLTGNDTFVTEAFSQTLTNKTIDADNNTISNLALGDEVTGASTDLTDSSNIPLLDIQNDFTVGIQSPFFQSDNGSPADIGILRLARIDDIAWRNQANDGNLLLEVNADNFLTFNGFFIAATSSQGTSGEVLTSNGSLLAPTFQDAASGVFPVSDDVMIIEGNETSSKRLRFEIDGNTAGFTRIITPPDQDITLVSTTDGTISNTNVNSGAAIDYSKLAILSSANILVGSGGGVATSVVMSGDIGISNTGVTNIVSGVIVNADVNASAAIDFSKLATLSDANILVGSVGNVATSVTMTGDIAIDNTGVTSIASEVIVNADVSLTADIDFSKLAPLASANILVGNGSAEATSVVMSGDTNISNAGVVTAQSAIITGKASKITPIGADQILISDSEDTDNLKRVTINSTVGAVPQGILMASYDTEIGSDQLFWTVSGFNTDDAAFLNRASPVPDALTFSRLTVNVSVNTNAALADVTFDLAIGPIPTLGNSTVTITGSDTGSFTDVTNSDALTSGINIAYQLNDGSGAASNLTLVGSSGILRGTP